MKAVLGACLLSAFVGSSDRCCNPLALHRLELPCWFLSFWFPFRDSFYFHSMVFLPRFLQLSAMDVSVRTTMKGAAKCDKHCELQNSVNRQELERILCFWDIPESMPASVSMFCYSSGFAILACCCERSCFKMCVLFWSIWLTGSCFDHQFSEHLRCAANCVCCICAPVLVWLKLLFELLRHEVRLANPLNLSI